MPAQRGQLRPLAKMIEVTPFEAAVIRSVETAGRTVAFSALTVAGSLVALLAFPLYFLRSFAYAGTSVVLIAAVGALVSLPALLAAWVAQPSRPCSHALASSPWGPVSRA